MSDQTVRLHVHVQINSVDDDYDTGITVAEWNAMTPSQRSDIRAEAWEVAAQNDNGGVWTTTDGATED